MEQQPRVQHWEDDASFPAAGYGQHIKGNDWRLVSTRVEACDMGSEYGIFVDMEAKDRPVEFRSVERSWVLTI